MQKCNTYLSSDAHAHLQESVFSIRLSLSHFWERNLLCSPGWHWTWDPLGSVFQVCISSAWLQDIILRPSITVRSNAAEFVSPHTAPPGNCCCLCSKTCWFSSCCCFCKNWTTSGLLSNDSLFWFNTCSKRVGLAGRSPKDPVLCLTTESMLSVLSWGQWENMEYSIASTTAGISVRTHVFAFFPFCSVSKASVVSHRQSAATNSKSTPPPLRLPTWVL